MTRKIFASVLLFILALSSCAYALSDSEYKDMMKNKEFADAEKELKAFIMLRQWLTVHKVT